MITLITLLVGTGILFLGWKDLVPSTYARLVGWSVVALSAGFSISNWGIEFGIIYAFLLLSCAAWLYVGLDAESWRPKATPERTDLSWPTGRVLLQQGYLFVMAVFVAGLASMFSAILVGLWVPGAMVDRMALVVLITPVIWGAAMFWLIFDKRSAQFGLPLVLIISGTLLYVF